MNFNKNKKRSIRSAFFDIDGTLLPIGSDHVPQSTVDSLHRLQDNGILIGVSTGRSLEEYLKLPLSDIKFDGYITLNGGVCFDGNCNNGGC